MSGIETDLAAMQSVERMLAAYLGPDEAANAANDVIARLRLGGFDIVRSPSREAGSALPFVVRQFEGQAWVPLREAAQQHGVIEGLGLTNAALANEIAMLRASREAGLDAERTGALIAETVRRVSNREAFRFVNINWTALGAAFVEEWPAASPTPDTEKP